jgi:hypothetical protein
MILTNGHGAKLGYDADAQTWCECGEAGAPAFWIGYWNDAKPGPADLARPVQIPGWSVVLGDGGAWKVPMALAWPFGRTKFPEQLGVAVGGKVTQNVVAKYAELHTYAEQVYDAASSAGGLTQDESVILPWACRALSVNYFGGLWELGSALGLFTTETLGDVLAALVNAPGWEMYRAILEGKKNLQPDFYTRFGGFAGISQGTFPTLPT